MNVYKTENIRNVVLLGHGGSGKTTLIEAISFLTGITNRQGKIVDGNTISDYEKEEIKRKFSISTSVIPIEFNGLKMNILDTPGYFDFVGEVEEALCVADAAIIVVSCKAGIEVGTVKAWEYCEKHGIPRMIYLSYMDDPNADFMGTVEALKEQFGKKIAPFHLPIFEKDKFVGYINAVRMAGRIYKSDGTYDECPIPDDVKEDLDPCRDMILEAVAETNEALMDKYFNGEDFTLEEIMGALRNDVIDGEIIPVQIGASTSNFGVKMVMETIERYFPSPDKAKKFKGINKTTGEEFIGDCDDSKPMSAYVFKTIMDPFIGKFSLIKVYSGVIKNDDTIYNSESDYTEKLSKLYVLRGKTTLEVKELRAGDIGAIAKLDVKTFDTISKKEVPIEYPPCKISIPYTYRRYKSKNKGDEDKISQALSKITAEDLTIKLVNDEENRQMLMYGIGTQQLDIVTSKILDRYKVEIELSKPKMAYRETIKKKVEAEGKHKKQSGGHGQYGHVKMNLEPSHNLERAFEFEEKVVGGAVPKNYFPAVEKGIQESVLRGPLAAYPVVGVKATLFDGSYHPVDSSEMAFKIATTVAFKKGFLEASPILLEPIASLKVTAPDKFTGDIMGDLNKRRGRVLGMNPTDNGKQVIEADIPMSELFGYSADLRSMTGGFGDFSYEFNRYEQAPSDVQEKEIEERAGKLQDYQA